MDNNLAQAPQTVVIDGVNSAFTPDQIGTNQLGWGDNISVRTGKAHTREFKLVQRATLPKGLVQGGSYFSVQNGGIVLSIWGQIWRVIVDGDQFTVDQIPLDWRNSEELDIAWMCETVGSLVIQDGQSAPIIYDGASARRSNIFGNEVPIGKAMAYGNGRLAVVTNDRNVQVGDITSQQFQSELQFTETQYLSGGGSFNFPQPIRGLAFLPVNNTGTGLGSLQVFGDKYVNSLRLDVTARETWDQIPGFQQVVLPGIGASGQNNIISVNQDLYWRDQNGNIWSLRSAWWDALSPGNAPVSREMARITDYETPWLMQYGSGIFFLNRILFTSSPYLNAYGRASFGSIISMDAAPLATMRGKSPPVYDGVLDGVGFAQLIAGSFDGKDRAFAVSCDLDGENRLWEILPNLDQDYYFLTNGSTSAYAFTCQSTPNPVTSHFESRRFDLGQPTLAKRLVRCDLWPTLISGQVTVTVYWRADNRTQWLLWGSLTVNAQMTNNDGQWLDLYAQERGRVKSLTIPDLVDGIDQRGAQVGFGFQVRVVWSGQMQLDKMTVWALPVPETDYSEQQDLPATPVENSVTNNVISYQIPVGGLGSAYTDQTGAVYADQNNVSYTGTVNLI